MAENLGIKNFSNMELTKQGLNLLAKIQAGAVSLRITRAAIGSGYLQSGQSAQELTSLINQMPSRTSAEGGTSTIVDIVYNKAMGNGKAAMQIKVQNGDTDFYIREIGIMAQDPDIGEILYAYTSCGGDVNGVLKYDGKNRVEYYFNAVTEIGNASDVNVNITLPSELTKEELDAEIAERKTADLELERKKADVGHSHVSADIVDVDTAPTSGSDKLVTSGGVYGALSGKQAKVTGGAETITSSNLTANRALVSDASGKVAVSAVTSTELGYLDGVTSNVQTQLDGKQETLDYNASDFLGCIEEVSQLCFEFGEELNFTNYAPQVNGVDVATVDDVNNKANIKKNTASTTGDIIDTHLTVGTRANGSEYGINSFASGYQNTASGNYSFASGYRNTASGFISLASGYQNTVSGNRSFVTGEMNTASGYTSFASGNHNTALGYQTKFGRYAKDGTEGTASSTTGDVFTIGIGTSSAKKNGFRLDYSGNGYFAKSVSGTGADYAEMWEWQDGNPNSEDRVGYFVSFIGDKIRIANENDDLRKVGIISGNPAVVGDNFADDWQGMYLQDIYGRNITEHKSYDAEYDENGNLIHEAYEADEYVLNPDYNSNEEYVPRRQRKEWDAVGTHGKLVVHDDGTCQVDGFCKPANGGIATASDTGFYVMERVNENHIRVYIR